jgi:hypothetical protein
MDIQSIASRVLDPAAIIAAAEDALTRLVAAKAASKRRSAIVNLQNAIADVEALGGDATAMRQQLAALQADAADGHDAKVSDIDRDAVLRGIAVAHCLTLLLPDGSERDAVAAFATRLSVALGTPKRGSGGRKPRADGESARGDGKTYRAKHSDGREFVNRGRPDAMAWRIRKSDATLTPDMVNAAIGRLRRGESTSEQVGPWTVTVETE